MIWLNCVFQTDYDEIELKKQLRRHFSDITIMSPKNFTKVQNNVPILPYLFKYANLAQRCNLQTTYHRCKMYEI